MLNIQKLLISVGMSIACWSIFLCVARAEIVVVASAKSTASNMNLEKTNHVFLGKDSAFPDNRKTHLIDLNDDATRTVFDMKVMDKTPRQVKSYWSRLVFIGKELPPKDANDPAALKKMLNDDLDAVGYMASSAIDATVKVLFTMP